MDHPTPPTSERTDPRERGADRYGGRYEDGYDEPSAATRSGRPEGDLAVPPRDAAPPDEIDPADRTAFRIGANLLTLLVLVLGGWWLWRHVLAPALLGPP